MRLRDRDVQKIVVQSSAHSDAASIERHALLQHLKKLSPRSMMFFRGGVPHAKRMLGKQLRISLQIGDKISAFFNLKNLAHRLGPDTKGRRQ